MQWPIFRGESTTMASRQALNLFEPFETSPPREAPCGECGGFIFLANNINRGRSRAVRSS